MFKAKWNETRTQCIASHFWFSMIKPPGSTQRFTFPFIFSSSPFYTPWPIYSWKLTGVALHSLLHLPRNNFLILFFSLLRRSKPFFFHSWTVLPPEKYVHCVVLNIFGPHFIFNSNEWVLINFNLWLVMIIKVLPFHKQLNFMFVLITNVD